MDLNTAKYLILLVCIANVCLGGIVQSGLGNLKAGEALIDCYPEPGSSQPGCESRGCIWSEKEPGAPFCTFPTDYGYDLIGDQTPTALGTIFHLQRRDVPSIYGDEIQNVDLSVELWSENTIRLKFFDPTVTRYEVPLPITPPSSKADPTNYNYQFQTTPFFSISVSRKSTGNTIFDTSLPGFIFSNQYLQVATILSSPNIYGFGENRHKQFPHDLSWKTWPLFARDYPPMADYNNANLYGVQPFYINLEADGNANGVFLLNSNALEIVLQSAPALTYRSIGGILDFYIFLGPTPENVVQQYTSLVGYPLMPPYWGMGYQLSRYGYTSTDDMRRVIQNMRNAGLNYDVQYSDIDYMDGYRDFTVDPVNYADLPALVQDLHANGQHFIPIIDAGIANTPSDSPPLVIGLQYDVFIKRSDGSYLEGRVWPGTVHFPDYSHPNASAFWTEVGRHLYEDLGVEYDGLWIDMNEPSNFDYGSTTGCDQNNWNYPPYVPSILDRTMIAQTICMDAEHQVNGQTKLHYDVHNLNGYYMAICTFNALKQNLAPKRPMIVTRSQYAGSGQYTNHWLGDNESSFDCLRDSIIGILEYNLFAMPLVGADICGFNGNTYEELCIRWSQLGAFYPFSRNHNAIGSIDQDPPSLGDRVVEANKKAFTEKYRLLPYLYTLLYNAHVNGGTVARALFHEFPTDSNTWSISFQFLWGSGLLISPVVTEGASSVSAYFPSARWFDYYTGKEVSQVGTYNTLDAPLDGYIPLHVRGGTIIPTQDPATTTVLSRQNPTGLIVAPDANGEASGSLFWDDGETLETDASGIYNEYSYSLSQNVLDISIVHNGLGDTGLVLNTIVIYGQNSAPTSVTVDSQNLDGSQVVYDSSNLVLKLINLNLQIPSQHTIALNP